MAARLGAPHAFDEALDVDAARSYQGYDYLAELLATQGYIVASMDVNDITDWSENGNEPGYMGRVEMMSKTFDLISDLERRQTGRRGSTATLIGRADLSRTSASWATRGEARRSTCSPSTTPSGPATAGGGRGRRKFPTSGRAIRSRRSSRWPRSMDRVGSSRTSTNTAFATALPYCDGDVYNLQGAPVFERNKQSLSDAGHPAIQYLVGGANHNYFNTVWANDDAQLFDFGDPECVAPSPPTRLSKAEQQGVGVALDRWVPAPLRRRRDAVRADRHR